MELVLPKIRTNDPHPAYAITTITPSAITAAGAPLYPEVPMDTNAVPPAPSTKMTNTPLTNAPVTLPPPSATKKP
jgi:hypothetical protein